MLGRLFPNSFGGESGNDETSLASGGTPEILGGEERAILSTYSVLPTNPTESTVHVAAKRAGELQAQTVLLKELSDYIDQAQKAALANVKLRVDHSKKAMENEKQFQKHLSHHGKNIYEYRVGTEAVKQNLDGYESKFNSVRSSMSL